MEELGASSRNWSPAPYEISHLPVTPLTVLLAVVAAVEESPLPLSGDWQCCKCNFAAILVVPCAERSHILELQAGRSL